MSDRILIMEEKVVFVNVCFVSPSFREWNIFVFLSSLSVFFLSFNSLLMSVKKKTHVSSQKDKRQFIL